MVVILWVPPHCLPLQCHYGLSRDCTFASTGWSGAVTPLYLVRGRGGTRSRAQVMRVKLYTFSTVVMGRWFRNWTVGFWWNFACVLILPMYKWCSAGQTRSYYLAGSYEQMIGFFTLFRYFFAAISAACGYNWLILCMRGINDVRCLHAKNH